MQGIARNPLADPSLVGVASGAGVGALNAAYPHTACTVAWLPFGDFIGALIAAAIVYVLARREGMQPAAVALFGMAVSAVGSALIKLHVIRAQKRAAVALEWLSGTTFREQPMLGVGMSSSSCFCGPSFYCLWPGYRYAS
ncbi:ABC-type Fe3+-siderophore transport system permease subunit [Paenibacillus baekrokdamisoli]|nr:ABC-type Fe3+-siderophore transport system permease subunit [Paenibacillus baekrokdamisoli]